MDKLATEKDFQTIEEWIVSPDSVFVPEYLFALSKVATLSKELDARIFATLRSLEHNIVRWGLWAFHTMIVYARKRGHLSAEILAELSYIKAFAEDYTKAHHGFNPCQHIMGTNPFYDIANCVFDSEPKTDVANEQTAPRRQEHTNGVVRQETVVSGTNEKKLHQKDASTNTDIEQRISELLADFAVYEDETELEEYLTEQEYSYSDDIYDFTFREAIRQGIAAYIEAHVDDFDLNDGCGYSTYLQETDDEKIQSLLMEYGAFRSWDEYSDCRFAMETVNCSVLAFDSDFQQEVFAKYLEAFNITEEGVATMLDDEDASDEFDAKHNRCFADDMSALGVEVQDGEISFVDKEDDDGMDLRDLIEELGWNCSFEGERWKLETNGVYFIL